MLKNNNYVYGPKYVSIPSHLNFSTYILEELWRYKDNVAMINGETHQSITYREIVQQAVNFAVSLSRLGVRKGQTIALFSENRQEYWSAVIGVIATGAILTTINTGYSKGELKHVMGISKPKYVICSPSTYKTHGKTLKSIDHVKKLILFGERAERTLSFTSLVEEYVDVEEFQPVDVMGQTDTLFILYSSGTTGLPKGVMLTHLNVLTTCGMPTSHDPRLLTLTISPWYHVMGLVGILTGLAVGRTGVYLPKFSVDLYLKTIEKYKIVQATVVPPVLVAICKADIKYDVSSVRLIYSGAAPLHRETVQAVYEKFPNVRAVLQGYGSTEMTLSVTRLNHDQAHLSKPGSIGIVMPGTVVKIVDVETRKPLGVNEHGEICVKGDLIMKGYIGRDSSLDFDDEGFYKTGDVGYYDEDKQFFIVDRLKELIKYKGFQVPPAEIEAVLLQYSSLADAAVVGLEDKEAGELPLAFVVVKTGCDVTEDDVKNFIKEKLSNPKQLRGGVRFVKQIPKSPSGKILRKELRKMLKTTKSKL